MEGSRLKPSWNRLGGRARGYWARIGDFEFIGDLEMWQRHLVILKKSAHRAKEWGPERVQFSDRGFN